MKRINITVKAEQYEKVAELGLNMSGLIRGLLDDHFSDQKIVFAVSPKVKQIYQQVISNFGGDDKELEKYFLEALDTYLREKTQQIESLRESIQTSETNDGSSD